MLRKACGALLLFVLTAAVSLAQQGGYLDVDIARVKPEKRAAFDDVIKKMVDANRRHNGDIWLALEVVRRAEHGGLQQFARELRGRREEL